MQVVGCQLDIVWEDRGANHARVRDMLAVSPPQPGGLVVLPEMFASGFSMDVAKIADNDGQPTQRFLSELAREYQVHIVGGVATRGADGRGKNEAVVIAPDGAENVRYQKIHPFSYGGETKCYSAGRQIVVFDIGGFTIAPFICYDLRFPEIFRQAIRQGANLFVVIANWPTTRVNHWTMLLQARAIENQAYVVGVNRCGMDPNMDYPGRSLVVDPKGQILSDGGSTPGVISAILNLQELQDYRRQFPALTDMRFVR
jgi:predicted amidohydrolase